MFRNKIFRFLYWFTATFFFFAAASMVISYLKPGPTEIQVEKWMAGMMSAMHNSLMGASMDAPEAYRFFLGSAAQMTVLTALAGLFLGLAIKVWKANDKT